MKLEGFTWKSDFIQGASLDNYIRNNRILSDELLWDYCINFKDIILSKGNITHKQKIAKSIIYDISLLLGNFAPIYPAFLP